MHALTEEMTLKQARELGLVPQPIITLVFFNGPAGSGKDHMAKLMAAGAPEAHHVKFSTLLKETVAAGLGIDMDRLEDMKDAKMFGPEGNKSYRDHQIELFEYLAKRYDDGILGRFVVNELEDWMEDNPAPAYAFMFSDAGRGPEVEAVANHFGKNNCLIVRMHREGHEFNDYRRYVDIDGVDTWDEQNDGTQAWAETLKWKIVDWLQVNALLQQGLLPGKAREVVSKHQQIEELKKEIQRIKGE